MNKRFRRRKQIRAQWWNYKNPGHYFITICAKNHYPYFGKIRNGRMHPNFMGAIVQGCWYQIPFSQPHVELGEFILMPNHLHGIIHLTNTWNSTKNPRQDDPNYYKRIGPQEGSVSTIIGSFKAACTRLIRQAQPDSSFAWLPRYWDIIIKDERAYANIARYIRNNPRKWEKDRFFEKR